MYEFAYLNHMVWWITYIVHCSFTDGCKSESKYIKNMIRLPIRTSSISLRDLFTFLYRLKAPMPDKIREVIYVY